jgi:hypothetical protein
MQTYLVVSKKYPYQSHVVASKEYCEEKMKLKKYQKSFYIREAIDNSDGCYRIVTSSGLSASIGYISFRRSLNSHISRGDQIKFIGTERDWLVMNKQDVCIQDSIRGYGRDISQKWSKELYKTEL